MTKKDFLEPQRVFINAVSKFNPYHPYHGKVGIGFLDSNSAHIRVFFTEGETKSMAVNPLYLSRKN